MKRALFVVAAALVGVSLIGLAGGDPRGASGLEPATRISLAGLALAVGIGLAVWAHPAERRRWWLLVPLVLLAVMGGLSGWIAGAEIWGMPEQPVRLASEPGGVAFLIGMTAAGMSLPALGLGGLAGRLLSRSARG